MQEDLCCVMQGTSIGLFFMGLHLLQCRSHLKIMLSDAGGIKTILDFIEMKSTELPKIKLTEKLYDFIIVSKSEVAVQ